MPYFTSPNPRITGPLPRRDILAVCAFLNRRSAAHVPDSPENRLERLVAAARMQ